MAKGKMREYLMWIILAVAVAAAAFFGYQYWQARRSAVPPGIASGNGRIEAKLVDICAREPLRVKDILVDEGDLVRPGQVVVKMDPVTLNAQLAEAKANVLVAQQSLAVAKSAIVRRKSEVELAKIEVERSRKLVEERAGSQRDYDVRKTSLETTTAAVAEEEAKLQTAMQQVEVAQANVAVVQTRIDDTVLTSPVDGRVLYRMAETGEVLAAGGKALTLVNLRDVYMEIYLPAEQAAKVKIGAEARITLDHVPGKAGAAYVSFVSPEAQFTPKQVETATERAKLMFRVKIQVPEELVASYIDTIKTGVRGMGYVKVEDSASWPDWLQNLLQPQPRKSMDYRQSDQPMSNLRQRMPETVGRPEGAPRKSEERPSDMNMPRPAGKEKTVDEAQPKRLGLPGTSNQVSQEI
jgi:HlyD family secretion protein